MDKCDAKFGSHNTNNNDNIKSLAVVIPRAMKNHVLPVYWNQCTFSAIRSMFICLQYRRLFFFRLSSRAPRSLEHKNPNHLYCRRCSSSHTMLQNRYQLNTTTHWADNKTNWNKTTNMVWVVQLPTVISIPNTRPAMSRVPYCRHT